MIGQKKKIFISFAHQDIVIARIIYLYLAGQNWPDVSIFFSDKSIDVGIDSWEECENNCRSADLGLVILTKNCIAAVNVQQEIGKLKFPYIIEFDKDLYKELGMMKKNQVFKLHIYPNPLEGLKIISQDIEKKLGIAPQMAKKENKHNFEKKYFKLGCIRPFQRRNPCALLESLRCAENEIMIMGENSLQPIHGGFEYLKRLLNDGGTVRVIINDYDSRAYADREEIEGAGTTKRIRADWIATIGNLKQLNQMNKNGNLEVKVIGKKMIGSIVIIDDWELQFNKYNSVKLQTSGGEREFNSLVFLYLNKDDGQGQFEIYKKEFESLWNDKESRKLDLDKIDLNRAVPKKFFR